MEQNAHTRRGVHNEAPPLCFNCPARSTMIGSRCAGQGAVHIRRHSAGAACDGAVNKLSAWRGERLARKRAVSGNRTSRFVVPRVYIRVIRLSTRSSTTRAQCSRRIRARHRRYSRDSAGRAAFARGGSTMSRGSSVDSDDDDDELRLIDVDEDRRRSCCGRLSPLPRAGVTVLSLQAMVDAVVQGCSSSSGASRGSVAVASSTTSSSPRCSPPCRLRSSPGRAEKVRRYQLRI